MCLRFSLSIFLCASCSSGRDKRGILSKIGLPAGELEFAAVTEFDDDYANNNGWPSDGIRAWISGTWGDDGGEQPQQ